MKVTIKGRRMVTGHRLAIRMPDGTLLSVPPMPPGTPSSVRVKVFELVLRRQIGLAQMTAQLADDASDFDGDAARNRLASMMGELPHRSARGMARAA